MAKDEPGFELARTVHFTPQARTRKANGWTVANRRIFLEHLSATCNVKHSCGVVGISQTSAYALRRRDADFRALWAEALECGYARLETMLLARAAGTDVAAVAQALSEIGSPGAPPRDGSDFDAGAHVDLTASLDTVLAFQLLAHHRRSVVAGGKRGGGPAPTKATPEALALAIEKQLTALNRRRGGAG